MPLTLGTETLLPADRNENRRQIGTISQTTAKTGANSMDNRLTEIEIKLAHIEQSLNDLSDVMYQQQGLIDRLEQNYDNLRQRIQRQGEGGTAATPTDEKPPHY
jgi:SlyX protein